MSLNLARWFYSKIVAFGRGFNGRGVGLSKLKVGLSFYLFRTGLNKFGRYSYIWMLWKIQKCSTFTMSVQSRPWFPFPNATFECFNGFISHYFIAYSLKYSTRVVYINGGAGPLFFVFSLVFYFLDFFY